VVAEVELLTLQVVAEAFTTDTRLSACIRTMAVVGKVPQGTFSLRPFLLVQAIGQVAGRLRQRAFAEGVIWPDE
jgi:hypothetical protein